MSKLVKGSIEGKCNPPLPQRKGPVSFIYRLNE